jgi:hypothetical protein
MVIDRLWEFEFEAEFAAEVEGGVGKVGAGGDRGGGDADGGDEGSEAFFEFGEAALVCGFLDFGFDVIEVDREVFLDVFGELGGGLAQLCDEGEEFGGGGVVGLGRCCRERWLGRCRWQLRRWCCY